MEFNYQALEEALHWNSLPEVNKLDEHQPAIDTSTLPSLPAFQVHGFDVVSSTNTVAWDLVRQGANAGTVVIAHTQHNGRGQWGHQWSSLPGGLYMSIVLTPYLPIEHAGQLTLSSAWGVASALQHYGIPVRIKWLNDLVVNHRKLGGILTETRIQAGHIHQAVVGIGINWSNPVPEMGINLQSILEHYSHPTLNLASVPLLAANRPVKLVTTTEFPENPPIHSLETLAVVVLQGVRRGYDYWRYYGSQALVLAYETLLVNLGTVVTLDNYSNITSPNTASPTPTYSGSTGTIVGITAKGQLRVQLQCPHQASVTEICLEPGTISLGYDFS